VSSPQPRPADRVVGPWQLLGERPRTGGWLPVVTRSYRMPDGSLSDWDIHVAPFQTVAVLALTEDGAVVLARQYRPGPAAVLLDLPGGLVDEGESLAQAALRELQEETGFTADHAEVVGSCWAFGSSTWRRHVAVARGCRRTGPVTSWGGDEYCQPAVVSLAQLRAVLRAGESTDVDLAYLALDAVGLL
jgi:ADP-ribose pyrophosphatase